MRGNVGVGVLQKEIHKHPPAMAGVCSNQVRGLRRRIPGSSGWKIDLMETVSETKATIQAIVQEKVGDKCEVKKCLYITKTRNGPI